VDWHTVWDTLTGCPGARRHLHCRNPDSNAKPVPGYSNTIRDELEDATAALDPFHVVRLGLTAWTIPACRVEQEQLGHRGRKHDPPDRIGNSLRAGGPPAEPTTAAPKPTASSNSTAGMPADSATPANYRLWMILAAGGLTHPNLR